MEKHQDWIPKSDQIYIDHANASHDQRKFFSLSPVANKFKSPLIAGAKNILKQKDGSPKASAAGVAPNLSKRRDSSLNFKKILQSSQRRQISILNPATRTPIISDREKTKSNNKLSAEQLGYNNFVSKANVLLQKADKYVKVYQKLQQKQPLFKNTR